MVSIKIGDKIISGVMTLSSSDTTTTDLSEEKVSVASSSDYINEKHDSYINSIKRIPYVTNISGVRPNVFNSIWIIGGKTSQIDYVHDYDEKGGSFTVCDMAQTVDFPRIYRSVYAMLRQIRLWLDAHKDSLILTKNAAEDQWLNMLDDLDQDSGSVWYPPASPGDSIETAPKMFKETRNRGDIPAIGHAVNFLNAYQGTVALWNYIVGTPSASVSARLHTADNAGVYIGANITVPIPEKLTTYIRITYNVRMTGQADIISNDESTKDQILYAWMRIPIASALPGDIQGSYALPGSTGASNPPSILDTNSSQIKVSDITPISITFKIPESSDMSTSYTIKSVLEIIPFYLDGGSATTYADSKREDRFESIGTNTWNISVLVERCQTKTDDEVSDEDYKQILRIERTKTTPHVPTCIEM